jgi:hypothetical protein
LAAAGSLEVLKKQGECVWARRKRKRNVVKNIRKKRANDVPIALKPDSGVSKKENILITAC